MFVPFDTSWLLAWGKLLFGGVSLGSVALFIWKASRWFTQQQDKVDSFFVDVRQFMREMGPVPSTLARMEGNHLSHIQESLKKIADKQGE